MEKINYLSELYKAELDKIRADFKIAKLSSIHSDEKGREFEKFMTHHFLKKLPRAYEVGTGFILDNQGQLSPQQLETHNI